MRSNTLTRVSNNPGAVHPKLNRANFPTPPPMDLTDESARDWFRALGHIRTKT